jgi:hypothetical protein
MTPDSTAKVRIVKPADITFSSHFLPLLLSRPGAWMSWSYSCDTCPRVQGRLAA